MAKAPRGKADRIVVTGATGFVGKNLCKALVERGYKIRVLVRSDKDDSYFRSLGSEIYKGDITDPKVADWLVDGAVGVFNLAGCCEQEGNKRF